MPDIGLLISVLTCFFDKLKIEYFMQFELKDIAKMIDHSLLHPTMTDKELADGCKVAIDYGVAAVCIKPYFVKECAEILKDSDVNVCSVIGFPHGNGTIKAKVYESKIACQDGATEIDMVVNVGKVLGEDWRYVKKEIYAVHKECRKHGAILKVIFENDFITSDKHKIKLCKICNSVGVEFIKTSTGYGFVKGEDGTYSYEGATEHDLILMRKYADDNVQIKAAGGVRTLDGLLGVKELGCTRLGASATVSIMEEAKKRLGLEVRDVETPTTGYYMELIKAFQKGTDLLNDIRSSVTNKNGFRLWWLGQSGFLIQYMGEHLLFDPYLSNSLTEKYKDTDKPHVRMSELVIDPRQLDMIDVVTSSHNHTDHLDAETLIPLFNANPDIKFVAPEANRSFVANRGKVKEANVIGLTNGAAVKCGSFEIIGLPAAHNDLKVNEKGQHHFMSFIAKFGKFTVYHSGDTLWFEGLEDILGNYKIDVAFLPINGNKPERKVAGNLNPDEAAKLGKVINAGCVIPHHYNLFTFNTESPDKFKAACEEYETPFKIVELGESYLVS